MNHSTSRRTRRSFLKAAGAATALTALPAYYAEQARAQENPQQGSKSPNEQFGIALVGCGGMGTGDAKNASRYGKVVALCDVDTNHIDRAKKEWPEAKAYSDFRKVMEQKDVDVVICGTVDHWHTLVSMAAMKAGKDVYTEKPLTLTIDEGKHLVRTQRETKRVLQTGTQQRSDIRFRMAGDIVRNGGIGKLQHVDVWLPAGLRAGPFQPSVVPANFDYDFWMGQTPKVEYVKERTHFSFRYWWEYSGGTITDWGAHHNDIVLWTLGMDRSGPVSVEGKQLVEMISGGYTAASEYDLTWTYSNGVTHRCRSTTASEWHGGTKDPKGQLHGIKFIGSDGWLWVTRGQIQAHDAEVLRMKIPEDKGLYVSKDHMGNFFDCVKSRQAPIAEAEIGHRSASMCHLGTIAVRLGRKLKWDPAKEEFVGDSEAQKFVAREMRKPYDYGMI